MRLVTYYIVHTIKNSIKKLFKSKAGIVILICIGIFIFSMVMMMIESPSQNASNVLTQQRDEQKGKEIFSMIVSAVFTLFFLYEIAAGEKKGSGIFQLPDVNFLFASPLRPQSILLFRIILQMGASLLASLYMIFQMPNLILNLKLSVSGAVGLLIAYFAMLVLGILCSVVTYFLSANYPRIKEMVRPFVYAVLVGFLCAFALLVIGFHRTPYEACKLLLYGKWFQNIPIIGWLKGFVNGFIDSNLQLIIPYAILLLMTAILFILIIYRTHVDYYEDALVGAQKLQERFDAAKEGRTVTRKHSKHIDRSEGIQKGFGANIFYYKAVYNRRRSAKLGIFTATSEMYYVFCIGSSVFFAIAKWSGAVITYIGILALVTFFLSLGASLASELSVNYIFLVPEKEMSKVFYCAVGDIRNFILDTCLPYAIGSAILGMEPMLSLGCYLLLVTFYYLAIQLGGWIDLMCPSTITPQIKFLICYVMKFFAAFPAIIVLVIALALEQVTIGVYVAAVFTAATGAIFMCTSPFFLRRGRN